MLHFVTKNKAGFSGFTAKQFLGKKNPPEGGFQKFMSGLVFYDFLYSRPVVVKLHLYGVNPVLKARHVNLGSRSR